MIYYTHMSFLGNDYCDVDISYDVIDGDDSVGLKEQYEFTATITDENGKEIDISDDLTEDEYIEVVRAIKKDLRDMQSDY